MIRLNEILMRLTSPGLSPKSDDDEARLLKLYWNRAELKKELASLDAQLHQLRDRLKQQEGLTGRIEEEHRALEILLGNPEYGFQALVHFQLRALWRACHAQLEQFGTELVRQREERESRRQIQEYQQSRSGRLRAIAEAESAAEAEVAAAESAVAAKEADISRRRRFWHYFTRQALEREVDSLKKVVAERAEDLNVVRAARKNQEQESWPKFPGLSAEGRRSINLAIIAYAQLLVCRLEDGGLARKAWEAQRLSVSECHYGTRGECMALMTEIREAVALVRDAKDVVGELKIRAEALRAAASYADSVDPLPLPESLPGNHPGAERRLDEPCVLRDNYWDIFKVLCS